MKSGEVRCGMTQFQQKEVDGGGSSCLNADTLRHIEPEVSGMLQMTL